MSKNFIMTVDIEPDYTEYLNSSYLGVELAIPRLLEVFDEYDISGDFFVTSDVVERYPSLIRRLVHCHHSVGSHGYRHEFLSVKKRNLLPYGNHLPKPYDLLQKIYVRRNFQEQLFELHRATTTFRKVLGFAPESFRAPNFSVNHDTVRALEQLEYKIDSSVLPGRVMRRWKLLTLYDFRRAPRYPYHPCYNDVAKGGNAKLIEFPLTENPMLKGAPLGVGFLNLCGTEATLDAIMCAQNTSYLTFLIHPYELVDLQEYYPNLKQGLFKYCFDNFDSLTNLIKALKKRGYNFCDSKEIIHSSRIE